MEILKKKLIKAKKLSRISWIISIIKIISFILAVTLLILSSVYTITTIVLSYQGANIYNNFQPKINYIQSSNPAMFWSSITFWIIFILGIFTTLSLNISFAVNCASPSIIAHTTEEFDIKDSLNSSMVMAIVSIFFISMILNIVVNVKVSNTLKSLKNMQKE